jgi:hypothetical protein
MEWKNVQVPWNFIISRCIAFCTRDPLQNLETKREFEHYKTNRVDSVFEYLSEFLFVNV